LDRHVLQVFEGAVDGADRAVSNYHGVAPVSKYNIASLVFIFDRGRLSNARLSVIAIRAVSNPAGHKALRGKKALNCQEPLSALSVTQQGTER
jgi:hypothetical protein